MLRRSRPLIVVASESADVAAEIAARLRREGNAVCIAHSVEGCLRVATSVGPDVVLLDPALHTRRLEELLRAHPTSAQATIMHLDAAPVSAPKLPEVVLHAA
jgi:DNA-binding response OmpR family regulator